jgi:Mrp family chromosome partitioning ATPase
LRLPLLITVPLMGPRRSVFTRTRGQIRLQPSEEGDGSSSQRKSWSLQNELTPYWEALRDRVLHTVKPTPDATCFIGVTGCERGNGATTVAAGLAFALSRNGDGRVLLIDANTDYASAHRLFSAEASPCMMDLLSDGRGNTAVIQPNLFLLSAREVDNKLPVLASSGKIEDLIRHVGTRQYSFVIYDMPQVTETSLTLRMSGSMNGVILVTEAEKTNRDTACHARDLLAQAQAQIMGVVLNKQRHVRKV